MEPRFMILRAHLGTSCSASWPVGITVMPARARPALSLSKGEMANLVIVKDKRTAQGRRSGNHCGRQKIPRKISGSARAGVHDLNRGGIFSFCSPLKNSARAEAVCQGGALRYECNDDLSPPATWPQGLLRPVGPSNWPVAGW